MYVDRLLPAARAKHVTIADVAPLMPARLALPSERRPRAPR